MGGQKHFGIIFQPERFGIILRLWLLLLRETEMSLTIWRWCRARVIILIVLVSSCAYGCCFFAAKSTTDLHTGVGVWVVGGACVCVGGVGVAVSWVRVGRSCNSD